ncbi:MAG: riboflavin synthase [Rikenellaceae bacterium]
MFSGIVEAVATVQKLEKQGSNLHLTLECPFTGELHIDQSIAHNGVCLTVVDIQGDCYTVTAIDETLNKTNLGEFKVGDKVNLERSMRPDKLLDGHIVQGHVDTTARCISVVENQGSWYFTFKYEPQDKGGYVTVEKGSVTVNGVSLTVCDSKLDEFSVAIIPYTYDHTNFHTFKVGSVVNLEFDIIGKYIARFMEVQSVKTR